MKLHRALVIGLCLVPGCKKDGEDQAADKAKAETADKDADKADGEADDEAKADDASTPAPGGAKGEGGEVPADCPASLSGRESTDRVIPTACKTVEVSGNYSMDGATLTIEPGVTLAFKDDAMLSVGYYDTGKLEIKGTAEEPVTFTSSGDDVAGVWKGVRLHGKANRSTIEGLVIEYAGGDRGGALKIDANDVEVKSSVVRHAKHAGVVIDGKGTLAEFSGNKFEDVGDVAMRVTPTVAGQIGEGNTFGDATVHVMGGKIVNDSTWKAIGTAFAVVGLVNVDGAEGTRATLTLDPGTTLRFDAEGGFRVGYYALGGLKAIGEASSPILLTAHEKQEAGSWGGLQVHGRGEASLEHVKLEYGGENPRQGVVYARHGSKLGVKHCTFSSNKHGVVLDGREPELETFDANTFEDTPLALQIPARSVGALGSENGYAGDPRIVITGGTVDQDATWKPQKGAMMVVDKPITVSATLDIEPGYVLHMEDGARISVGQYDNAALRAQGKESDPIKFVGLRDDAGSWKSIVLYGKSGGNILENVVVRNAGGKAGIEVTANADAKITNLTCEKCEVAAVTWHRNAKVETSGIKAAEGTPKAEDKP
jgi:hypothetical protein